MVDRFEAAFRHAPNGMGLLTLDGRFGQVNDALVRVLGHPAETLRGMTLMDVAHPDDREAAGTALAALLLEELDVHDAELRVLHPIGEEVWIQLHMTVVRDEADRPMEVLVQVQDVTERRRFEARLQHMADHDPLTGLFNRRRFEQELERHVTLVRRYGSQGALIMFDIDHFKYVNDTLGHSAGDDLIVLVADVLRGRLRDSDILARLGGDEFAVLLPAGDLAGAKVVAESLVSDLRGQVRSKDGKLYPVTVSVGVAPADQSIGSSDELLANADLAMYDAKEGGRDRAECYQGDDRDEPRIRSRMRWMERIKDAMDEDRFVLHAQPIVDLGSGEVVEHELLLRMLDREGEVVPPAAFLPVAERFGLICALDRLVIAKAVALAASRRALGERTGWSINLSAKSLAEPGLVDFISEQLAEHDLDPSCLTFEITETAAVTNVGLARTLAEGLHDLGCKLSLDDFGAGFGSFYYLKHLPFDVLKIDGEFVRGCVTSTTDQLVIDAVVRVARGLGKTTVAEFTGDRETASFLRRAGVDCAQGFYLGKPVPLADVPVLLPA